MFLFACLSFVSNECITVVYCVSPALWGEPVVCGVVVGSLRGVVGFCARCPYGGEFVVGFFEPRVGNGLFGGGAVVNKHVSVRLFVVCV